MNPRRTKAALALPLVAALALAACGSDDSGSEKTTAAPADTSGSATTAAGGGGTGVSLADVCPSTIALQTDWMPEAEHGFLYQMIGSGYTVDKGNAYVTGPLIDADGNDTGVKFQVRSGGGAQNFQSVTDIMYTASESADTLLIGYVYTDEGIKYSATKPTIAIESGFEKNPQMIMWDPATYPDVQTIEDLGKTDATVRYFGGAAYMDYFTSQGILKPSQVDGSYSGDSSLFIADEGKAAQQGFGSAEPYNYEEVLDGWKKPVKFQYINDAGWTNYAESIAAKPEDVTKYADCFTKLVPIIQQAAVDYLADPTRANAIILDAVDQFGADFGWVYTQGNLDYGVKVMQQDGLVANGPDGVMGKFDMDRVNDLIQKAIPVYTAQDNPPKAGLTADQLVTNQFLDESIGIK